MAIKKNTKLTIPKLEDEPRSTNLQIRPARFSTGAFPIEGTASYVQNAFSRKSIEQMKIKQEAGSQGGKGRQRTAKDFMAAYEGAKHVSIEGWIGIPATAFRKAMISACRIVGFKMTLAKLSVFVEADGFDKVDGAPLVKITKGEPSYAEHVVRNETGVVDIRPRPMWQPGWQAVIRVVWDEDQFSAEDVANLLDRVGKQVGIGEGRPDSPNSCGMGWGTFILQSAAARGKRAA